MRSMIIGLACLASAIAATPAEAGGEPFVGEIALYAFGFCPQGWVEADGRLLPVAGNTALFSLLGTTYGGDGKTTFALPKLIGPGGARYCMALYGIYPQRP